MIRIPSPPHHPSHCTAANVWCWLKKFPAPVESGMLESTVENEDTFEVLGSNPVQVHVHDATRTLHNVTRPRHIFHNPGQT